MGTTTQTQRVDEIVKMAGGTFPLHGRVGLCRRFVSGHNLRRQEASRG